MGGMIAQHLASAHPRRVKSLTLMMTNSGARGLPRASAQVQRALLSRPRGRGDEAVADHLQHILELIGSPAYRGDPVRTRERLLASVRAATARRAPRANCWPSWPMAIARPCWHASARPRA